MNSVTILLNSEELQNLGLLLDIAVKAGGIQAAKAAVPLYEKLEKVVSDYNAANPSAQQDSKESD